MLLLVLILTSVAAARVAHDILEARDILRATGQLPPDDLSRILIALEPHAFGTSSPAQCASVQIADSLGDALWSGSQITHCRVYECGAPVAAGAAAVVLERAGIRPTILPLTLTAEVAYRFVPNSVLVDLYSVECLQRHDLRALSREELGFELDHASPSELVWLMARAETAAACRWQENPDIVRFVPQPTCDDFIALRLEEFSARLGEAGYPLEVQALR